MGIAVHNYYSTFGYYPSGGSVPWPNITRSNGSTSMGHDQECSWAFQILPYMEEDALFKSLDDNRIKRTPVAAYNCPSSRRHGRYQRRRCRTP